MLDTVIKQAFTKSWPHTHPNFYQPFALALSTDQKKLALKTSLNGYVRPKWPSTHLLSQYILCIQFHTVYQYYNAPLIHSYNLIKRLQQTSPFISLLIWQWPHSSCAPPDLSTAVNMSLKIHALLFILSFMSFCIIHGFTVYVSLFVILSTRAKLLPSLTPSPSLSSVYPEVLTHK